MSSKKRLGELLIEAGVIDEAMLQSALGHQRRWGGRIGQAILDLKLTSEASIVEALARKLGFEVARLRSLDPLSLDSALKLVGKDFAVRHTVFPMAADHSTLTVAMADPTNLSLSDELRFRTNRRVKVCIGGDREITEAIRAYYPSSEPQALEAISLDTEVSGEFLPPLADPFGGGSTEALEKQMQRGPHPSTERGAPPSEAFKVARAELFGAIPRGGFSHGDEVEELQLTPIPLDSAPVGRPAPAPVLAPTPALAEPRSPSMRAPASAPVSASGPATTGPAAPAWPQPHPAPVADVVFEEEASEGRIPLRPLTPKEIVVLDALERLAAGQDDVPLPVKPSQVAAALLRIMLRQKIVTQQELLDELLRK
jgi:Type II secretion system (T2SS), protein E, N-terminal domain